MTSTMSHYFIFTGHNSYLTGNQLSSSSSEKPIVEALRRGVRVVELDLWPNSNEDDVSVFHGKTLTSSVSFETCLLAIKENAFLKSDFPVIVTLEDHLPPKLQEKAAKTICETFGEILYKPKEKDLKEFPSPQELKRRILISTKPPKIPDDDTIKKTKEMIATNEIQDGGSFVRKDISSAGYPIKDIGVSTEAFVNKDEGSDEDSDPPESRPDTHVSTDYRRLISIRAGKPKGVSLVDALKVAAQVKRVSLSEPQLKSVAESNSTEVVKFTHSNFLRVYPYGLRFDSSNYDPMLAWAHGAQMVALNMQGYGKYLWIVQGFFRGNGGCGYVRKPPFLQPGSTYVNMFDPENPLPVKLRLKVRILTGYGWLEFYGKRSFDTLSDPDFYTRVGIAGVDADKIMKRTKTKKNKWIPWWDEEFEFELRVPELAVLRLEVYEEDQGARDDFAGQICLPVSELKSGYKVVHLCNGKGDVMELADGKEAIKLLLKIQISAC
ncbi:hypothetical protein KP509_05G054300 [Ceratopteris richardii]|nr:hypothetical protein KP509_05G054300 [Ceratopteris richardii]